MSEQYKGSDEKELDLSIIGEKFKDAVAGVESGFFSFVFLIKRYLIVLILLFVGGAVLGWYIDKTGKSYNNEIIVMPNFGSTDHLYSQVDLIQSKITEGDTVFLNEIGIKNPKKLAKIEIKPINNVYEFAYQRPSNFELIKLMAEDGSINKVIEDEVTSKNYTNHKVIFQTRGLTDRQKTLDPLIKFLNSSTYFDTIKKLQTINLETKMRLNDSVINQIDGIIEEFRKSSSSGSKSSNLVYYNENTQLSDILKRKDELINEQATLRVSRVNYVSVVKEIASSMNIRNKSGLSGKMKLVVPIFFTFMFLTIVVFVSFIKRGLNRNKR